MTAAEVIRALLHGLWCRLYPAGYIRDGAMWCHTCKRRIG